MDELGNAAAQIEQRVHLDRAFGCAKSRPGEQGQAEIDGGRIERVDGVVQFDAEVVVDVQRSGSGDENLSEIGIDAPVARLVGICQRALGDTRTDAQW